MDLVMIDSVGDMLNMAISMYGMPPKAVAIEVECSISHMYSALKDVKSVPVKARQQISKINLVAAAAVAMEATGFKRIFGFQQVDRHVQSMILRMRKKNKEASVLMEELPVMLLDKNSKGDLTAEEFRFVHDAAVVLIEHINCTLNLAMELEVKFHLGLAEELQKENPSSVGALKGQGEKSQQEKYTMAKRLTPQI